MRKGYAASFKVGKTKVLTALLKGWSNLSKLLYSGKEFSMQTSAVILASREEAFNRGNDAINVEHLLLALLLKSEKGKAIEILNKLNCNVKALQRQIEEELDKFPQKEKTSNIPFTTDATAALKSASSIADEFQSKEIENEHLLLAILKSETSLLVPIFRRFNLTYHNCYNQLKSSV